MLVRAAEMEVAGEEGERVPVVDACAFPAVVLAGVCLPTGVCLPAIANVGCWPTLDVGIEGEDGMIALLAVATAWVVDEALEGGREDCPSFITAFAPPSPPASPILAEAAVDLAW